MYQVKENSWRAWIAAKLMRAESVAIVFGHTIHIYGVEKASFLRNKAWLRHELKHVEQYQRHGYVGFIGKYLVECLRHGYFNNCFEKEARAAEPEPSDR